MKRIKKTESKSQSSASSSKGDALDNGSSAELARLQAKDPTTWTVSEVGKWLDFLELGMYKIVFIENSISGAELFELEAEDLASINVRKLGHRKKILKRIGQLKKNSPAGFKAQSGWLPPSLKEFCKRILCFYFVKQLHSLLAVLIFFLPFRWWGQRPFFSV